MKFFSKFIALVLLLIMPLHLLAASNIAVCNSMMQITVMTEHADVQMPCHEPMDSASEKMQDQHPSKSNLVCESHCAAICASLGVTGFLRSDLLAANLSAKAPVLQMTLQHYTSITLSSLLRPPIFLI